MNVVRVVAQHQPNLFAILGLHDLDAEPLPKTLPSDVMGTTYYKAEAHDRWVLYKRARMAKESRRRNRR